MNRTQRSFLLNLTMKAFSTHQRLFQMMCIFPLPDETKLWKKYLWIIFAISLHVMEILGLISSVMFVITYIDVDLEGSVKTLFQIAAYVNVTYVMIITLFQRSQFTNFIKMFQTIFDASKFQLMCM